jgi:hypothetical protein
VHVVKALAFTTTARALQHGIGGIEGEYLAAWADGLG